MNEMYRACVVQMDANQILSQTRGFNPAEGQLRLASHPSLLPALSSDQGLFKCILGNAIQNAKKYGLCDGAVTTEAS